MQAKLDDASNEELLQFAREARDEGSIEELIQNKTLPPSLYGALDERLDEVLDTATDAHCYSPLAVHSLFDLRLPGNNNVAFHPANTLSPMSGTVLGNARY